MRRRYLPTYSLRYCPGTGARRLPLDAFEPRVPGGELEGPVTPAVASLLPAGYTTNPFPMFPHTLFKSYTVAYPPVPTVHHLVADPSADPADATAPQRLHGILRFPLFPTFATLGITDPAEVAELSDPAKRSDLPLPAAVFHLVVRMTWSVGHDGAAALESAQPLYNASVHADDAFVAQNAMPRYASAGYGALEGKYCEGPAFGFYVVGDTLARFQRPGGASALAGGLRGIVGLTQPRDWSPSRKAWFSVGAVAYQDGALYIAREVMSAPNGAGLASDKVDADIDYSGLYANRSELVKVFNADKEVVGPVVVMRNFVPGVRGVLTPESAGNSTSATRDRRLFFFTHRSAEVFAVRTSCSAGTVFDLEAGDCVPLPGGYFSNRTGLLMLSEAGVCPENHFAPPGSVACEPCPKGTFSSNRSAACAECPQNSFGEVDGRGCQPW
eukprot:tig00021105_g18270.t1